MRPFDSQGGSGRSIDHLRRLVAIEDALQIYRDAYPDVDVRRRFVPGSAGAALVTESEAAALLVVGAPPRRRRRRAPLGPVAQTAFRSARSPVAIIRASTLSDRAGRR